MAPSLGTSAQWPPTTRFTRPGMARRLRPRSLPSPGAAANIRPIPCGPVPASKAAGERQNQLVGCADADEARDRDHVAVLQDGGSLVGADDLVLQAAHGLVLGGRTARLSLPRLRATTFTHRWPRRALLPPAGRSWRWGWCRMRRGGASCTTPTPDPSPQGGGE